MNAQLSSLYHSHRNLLLYGAIGAFSAFLDFIVYTLLVNVVGLQYILANCISIFVGITTSFMLNRSYNFCVKDHPRQRFSLFLTIGLCGLLLSNLILYLSINYLNMGSILSKLLSIILVSLLQFLANKHITFKA